MLFRSLFRSRSSDVTFLIVLSVSVLILYVVFYNRIFLITFDEAFARTTGLRVDGYNMLIAGLTAITVVLGMRMMGALLISSLLILPALTAMRVFKSFRAVIVFGIVDIIDSLVDDTKFSMLPPDYINLMKNTLYKYINADIDYIQC